MKTETELHDIQIFSSYLTENVVCFLYKAQAVNRFISVCPYNY